MSSTLTYQGFWRRLRSEIAARANQGSGRTMCMQGGMVIAHRSAGFLPQWLQKAVSMLLQPRCSNRCGCKSATFMGAHWWTHALSGACSQMLGWRLQAHPVHSLMLLPLPPCQPGWSRACAQQRSRQRQRQGQGQGQCSGRGKLLIQSWQTSFHSPSCYWLGLQGWQQRQRSQGPVWR